MNAITLYRFGNVCYKKHISLLPQITKIIIFLLFNTVLPPTASIGKDIKFSYGAIGCVVHSHAVIGKRVIIGQNTTIGRALDPISVPTIGNDVYISAGARIIGGINVGNNVIIRANAVVNKTVPDKSIVAGVPAKIVRTVDQSSWELLKNIY